MESKRENSGALFKNDKEGVENRPDYAGPAEITCVNCNHNNELRVASWLKESQNGMKYMSLSFSEKKKEVKTDQVQNDFNPSEPVNLDDIPF